MDHVWNSLRQWEMTWIERIEYEQKQKDWEGKGEYIAELKGQLASIQKAKREIGKWT